MNQFLPDPDIGPPLHPSLTPQQRIEAWIDVMHFGDQLFLAGLPHRSKPGEDPITAMRESYARHMEDQDRKLLAMAQRFGAHHGR